MAAGIVNFHFTDAAVGNTNFDTDERASPGAAGGVDAPPIGSFQDERKLSLPSRAMLRRILTFDLHLQQQVTATDTSKAAPPHSPDSWTCDNLMGANALKPLTLLPKAPYES